MQTIKDLKQLLKQLSPIIKENSTHYIIRCPYCGDSKKNAYHCHFYITKESPHLFHCFRAECEASGNLLTLLTDFDLLNKVDVNLLANISKHEEDKKITSKINQHLVNKLLNNKPITNKGKEYILSRLLVDYIPEFFERFIIYDLRSFISKLTMTKPINKLVYNNLDKYVGILSYSYAFITCRLIDTSSTNLPRYYRIQLSDERDFFITFPFSNISFLSNHGHVIIGEGIFDVINGYYHLVNNGFIQNNETNIILVANGGKTYRNALSYLYKKFGVITWDKHILLDKDVNINDVKYQLYYMKYGNHYMYYNTVGKDFGDLKCQPEKLTWTCTKLQ